MSTRGHLHTPGPHTVAMTAVTDGNGFAVFPWPAGAFAAPPVVALGIEAATVNVRTARIAANSAASTSVQVIVTTGLTILGISVLGPGVPAAGVTVHAVAVAP